MIIDAKQKLGLGVATSEKPSVDERRQKIFIADDLHKPVKRKFARLFAADLVEMQKIAKWNKGIRYLLAVIDVFSKYGWLVPTKDKTGKSVTQAFQKIFTQDKRIPKFL